MNHIHETAARVRFFLAVLGGAIGFLAVFGLVFGLIGLAGALARGGL
jgi:hypothetical protein